MKKNLMINRYYGIALVLGIGYGAISFCLTQYGLTDTYSTLTSAISVSVISALILILLHGTRIDAKEKKIIIVAFMIRSILLLFDYYSGDFFGDLLNIRDYSTFEVIAKSYYNGNFSSRSTNYPYIVNSIYHIVGANVFLARFVNVAISIATLIIVCDLLNVVEIDKHCKIWALSLLSFSPYVMIYSILLMREPIYMFSLTWSFCLFCKWKITKEDKFIYYSVLSSVPALYLHSGYISFPIVYLFYYIFDKTKNNKKNFAILMIRVIVCLIVIVLLSQLQSMHYIAGNSESGLIYSIQTTYRQHRNQGGGSQYLSWMRISNPVLILIYTPIRMFFFLTSPFILDWRGVMDISSFIFDGLFHMLIIYNAFKYLTLSKKFGGLENNKSSQLVKICRWGLWIIFLTSILFCWGVTTAGSAIRHRNCLFGIECILLGIELNFFRPSIQVKI